MWPLRLSTIILVVSCLVGNIFAQTFQYSRGWTNGKRGGLAPSREAACQLHRLKAILDGKTTQLYWPCEWFSYLDAGPINQIPGSVSESKISTGNDMEKK